MKKKIIIPLALAAALLFSFTCYASESAGTVAEGSSGYLVTNVYGDGQKPWYLVLDYGSVIEAESVSSVDFSVEGYTVEAVYTNSEPSLPLESVDGRYVLVELSTDYTTDNYNMVPRPEGEEEGNSGGLESGGGPRFFTTDTESNRLSVTWTQQGELIGADGSVYPSFTEGRTTDYTLNDNLLVKDFSQYVFTASDGMTLMYSLFLPEEDSLEAAYPLLLFMPDATGEGSDPYLALTESLGGVIWASSQSQAAYPCIVLIPQYEQGNTSGPSYTMELLSYILGTYSVDASRIYLVGQSSGTIRSISMMIDYPDTFAGAMLVAGQADAAYVDRLGGLASQKIWMICSAGDLRAYPGMTAVKEAVEENGCAVTASGWSARLSDEEQEALAESMRQEGTDIYFTVYDEGTVMREDVPVSAVTEHMNTWRVAYDLDTVRGWLFEQDRDR